MEFHAPEEILINLAGANQILELLQPGEWTEFEIVFGKINLFE